MRNIRVMCVALLFRPAKRGAQLKHRCNKISITIIIIIGEILIFILFLAAKKCYKSSLQLTLSRHGKERILMIYHIILHVYINLLLNLRQRFFFFSFIHAVDEIVNLAGIAVNADRSRHVCALQNEYHTTRTQRLWRFPFAFYAKISSSPFLTEFSGRQTYFILCAEKAEYACESPGSFQKLWTAVRQRVLHLNLFSSHSNSL